MRLFVAALILGAFLMPEAKAVMNEGDEVAVQMACRDRDAILAVSREDEISRDRLGAVVAYLEESGRCVRLKYPALTKLVGLVHIYTNHENKLIEIWTFQGRTGLWFTLAIGPKQTTGKR